MTVHPAVYSSTQIAALFARQPGWWRRNKRQLIKDGFPAPLACPGRPRWSKNAVDRWFDGAAGDTSDIDAAWAAGLDQITQSTGARS